jgi:RNA polymerase sigma-70 factor (ECF subfamily)
MPRRDPSSSATSFEDVYRENVRSVARWVERLGGPSIDRDDVVQEIFMTVSSRLPAFRGEAKLSTWLFRVTARVVANHRRAARRRAFWTGLFGARPELLHGGPPAPGEALEERQAAERFYRVLDHLPERHREVLVLFEIEELATEEIARLLDRPPATIRVWLHRARVEFERAWRRHAPDENRGRQSEPDGQETKRKGAAS